LSRFDGIRNGSPRFLAIAHGVIANGSDLSKRRKIMKVLHLSVLAVALLAAYGCSPSTPGGPGVPGAPGPRTSSAPADKPIIGQADETFNLSLPTLATKVKQGETVSASISVKRGKNFDEDVTLRFADVPKGVTVDPARPVIKHGDSEAKVTFKAADDAALGDFTLKVTGHPTKGADATSEFKLSVAEK
jgi:hypothetical protein